MIFDDKLVSKIPMILTHLEIYHFIFKPNQKINIIIQFYLHF